MNWASRLDWQIKMAVAGARRQPSVCVEVQQTDVNTDPSSSSSKSGKAWGRGGGSACQSRVWSGANPLPANSALMIYAVQLWQEGRPTAVAHGLIIRFQQQAANKPTNKQHNTVGPPAVGVTEQTRECLPVRLYLCGQIKFTPPPTIAPSWMLLLWLHLHPGIFLCTF